MMKLRLRNYPMTCHALENLPSHEVGIDERIDSQGRTPPESPPKPLVPVYHMPTALEPLPLSAQPWLRALAAAPLTAASACIISTAVALTQLPKLARCLSRELLSSRHQGPLMKTFLAPLFVGSCLLLPVVTALGSACYGLARGFSVARRTGMPTALRDALRWTRGFRDEAVPAAVMAVRAGLQDSAKLALPL